MMRRMRRISILIALATFVTPVYAQILVHATPPSNVEWGTYRNEARAAEMSGDFASAAKIARDLHSRCRMTLGEMHPETTVVAAAVREYDKLNRLDERTKHQFIGATTTRIRGWQTIEDLAAEVLPATATM